MNRFIVLAVIVGSVYAEAPGGYGGSVSAGRNFAFGGGSSGSSGSGLNEYVDQQLLERVAAVIASNGDGTARGQDNEGDRYVDASIFSRVASSLAGSNGRSQGGSTQYGAPAPSGDAMLGQPTPAERIAEWDLSETRSAPQQGGYDSAPAPAPAPQQPSQGYSQGPSSRQTGGAISFGNIESAQRVSEFEVQDSNSNQQQQRGNNQGYSQQSQGGYN